MALDLVMVLSPPFSLTPRSSQTIMLYRPALRCTSLIVHIEVLVSENIGVGTGIIQYVPSRKQRHHDHWH